MADALPPAFLRQTVHSVFPDTAFRSSLSGGSAKPSSVPSISNDVGDVKRIILFGSGMRNQRLRPELVMRGFRRPIRREKRHGSAASGVRGEVTQGETRRFSRSDRVLLGEPAIPGRRDPAFLLCRPGYIFHGGRAQVDIIAVKRVIWREELPSTTTQPIISPKPQRDLRVPGKPFGSKSVRTVAKRFGWKGRSKKEGLDVP